MFTGIIESMGTVISVRRENANLHIDVASALSGELRVDQSVAHNGICLTVTRLDSGKHNVTAVAETIAKTTIGNWKEGDMVNLERSLKLGDRIDGHFVQGHVDATATCIKKEEQSGSWKYTFRFPAEFAELVIEKGSVCIDGVSLTAFEVGRDHFSVAIIPYTYEHTNFRNLNTGSTVNIEFDVLGKFLARKAALMEIGDASLS